MIRIISLLLLSVLLASSCGKKEVREEVPEYFSQEGQVNILKSNASVVGLSPESEKLVKEWPEYQKFTEMIVRYREISMSDALLNSVELEELAKQLKDSLRIEKLDIPSVRMRLNVLHNEAKRLSDMSTIPTITEQEVLQENDNVLDAYAALNIKINDLSKQDKINRELGAFAEDQKIAKDTLPPPEPPEEKKLLKQLN